MRRVILLIALSWVSPGDDGDSGRATVYDLRYAADSSMLVEHWDSCGQVENIPQPDSAGTREVFDVPLPPGRWYIALKTADEVPNWSEVSNIILREVTSAGVDEPPIVEEPTGKKHGFGCR